MILDLPMYRHLLVQLSQRTLLFVGKCTFATGFFCSKVSGGGTEIQRDNACLRCARLTKVHHREIFVIFTYRKIAKYKLSKCPSFFYLFRLIRVGPTTRFDIKMARSNLSIISYAAHWLHIDDHIHLDISSSNSTYYVIGTTWWYHTLHSIRAVT